MSLSLLPEVHWGKGQAFLLLFLSTLEERKLLTGPNIKHFLRSAAATLVPQRSMCVVFLCLVLECWRSAPVCSACWCCWARERTLSKGSKSRHGARAPHRSLMKALKQTVQLIPEHHSGPVSDAAIAPFQKPCLNIERGEKLLSVLLSAESRFYLLVQFHRITE